MLIPLSCQAWVGIFGLVAALASWRLGWKATALPSAAAPSAPDVQPYDVEKPISDETEKTPILDDPAGTPLEGTVSGTLEDL